MNPDHKCSSKLHFLDKGLSLYEYPSAAGSIHEYWLQASSRHWKVLLVKGKS